MVVSLSGSPKDDTGQNKLVTPVRRPSLPVIKFAREEVHTEEPESARRRTARAGRDQASDSDETT
jgi:hypothetical protein